jgi:hypothetical protein
LTLFKGGLTWAKAQKGSSSSDDALKKAFAPVLATVRLPLLSISELSEARFFLLSLLLSSDSHFSRFFSLGHCLEDA